MHKNSKNVRVQKNKWSKYPKIVVFWQHINKKYLHKSARIRNIRSKKTASNDHTKYGSRAHRFRDTQKHIQIYTKIK